jgi:chemotaxis protein MotB
MAARRKHEEEGGEEGPSAERWLLTYSDMITLLMVLFIVLFALGQTNIRKFDAFKNSFHAIQQTEPNTPPGGPGVLSAPSAIALSQQNPFAALNASFADSVSGMKATGSQASGTQAKGSQQAGPQANGAQQPGSSAAAQEARRLAQAEAAMKAALAKLGLENEVTFQDSARGLIVSILTDKILFPTDSAQLQSGGVEIIDAIAPVLAALPNQVDVEGDTDNVPIHGGPYANNWALSAARAVAVVQDLIHHHGIDPRRLQATGNGATRPIVANDTPEHRSENRRVEIVIFSTTVTTP